MDKEIPGLMMLQGLCGIIMELWCNWPFYRRIDDAPVSVGIKKPLLVCNGFCLRYVFHAAHAAAGIAGSPVRPTSSARHAFRRQEHRGDRCGILQRDTR